jgi:hypothetical protein
MLIIRNVSAIVLCHMCGSRSAIETADPAPTLLGSGERLFDGVGDNLHGLGLVGTVATPKAIYLKFARR